MAFSATMVVFTDTAAEQTSPDDSINKNLKKGYSIIRKAKRIINKSDLINKEDNINLQLVDKTINLKIKKLS